MNETGLIAALAAVTTLLVRQFVAPFFSPWYEERLRKAQFRVAQRAGQRQMIENELGKGFDDLSSARVVAMMLNSGQQDARERGMALFAKNEEKWGTWRPYLIEDVHLLNRCEEFRTLIRDHRIATVNTQPAAILVRNQADEAAASAKARELMVIVRKKGL